VHDRKDDVKALAAAAAVERDERGIGWVGGHDNPLAALQNLGEHFLRSTTHQPVAFFGDANGNRFVFVRVQAAHHGSGRGERNLMLAGAATEENANAESFVIGGHRKMFSQVWLVSFQL